MEFEFDSLKSQANKVKHGIDFIEAQALWLDENRSRTTARADDEPRILIVGQIEGRHWTAVITYRGERIRIISVRRSRDREVEIYEGS